MKEEQNIVDAEIVDESTSAHSEDTSSEKAPLKTRLLSVEHWLRFVFMALFLMIACVAGYVVFVLVIVQFLFALITGEGEERLRGLGSSLSQYFFQIFRFLTYNTEDKPFPFADWPSADQDT
jgi:hypothetical protein